MSNSFNKSKGVRPDNKEKVTYYIQDDENTMMWKPLDMHGSKFWGSMSKLLTLSNNLNVEYQEKYTDDY